MAHTHGGRGGEQVARTYQRRKFRLKNGIVHDSLLQLDILNFTQHTENSGVGGSSAGVNLGRIKVRDKLIDEEE